MAPKACKTTRHTDASKQAPLASLVASVCFPVYPGYRFLFGYAAKSGSMTVPPRPRLCSRRLTKGFSGDVSDRRAMTPRRRRRRSSVDSCRSRRETSGRCSRSPLRPRRNDLEREEHDAMHVGHRRRRTGNSRTRPTNGQVESPAGRPASGNHSRTRRTIIAGKVGENARQRGERCSRERRARYFGRAICSRYAGRTTWLRLSAMKSLGVHNQPRLDPARK